MADSAPFLTLHQKTRRPADSTSLSSRDSTVRRNALGSQPGARSALTHSSQYGSSAGDDKISPATHDTSRVNYHVKDIEHFAVSLEGSASRAFPNRGSSQRYQKVHAILLHWNCDDLFVLPELEDLEACFRDDYSFETEKFSIPTENSHLELMLRIGAMIKEHESTETLFIVYYGGHAKIDDSRQSTWCATRSSDSPWLQWSAIQTLLERSLSDVLILLDCCAGAASATFPSGNSVTETISASSWDAIAPDPGRYSFTTALIEVMSQWKRRVFSAAMLHAEVLARLKHPRPVMINGRNYEARSTPVHFMMTNNHKVPSIELARVVPGEQRPPSPPDEREAEEQPVAGRSAAIQDIVGSSPNEDTPHVMISLALEDNQRLNISEWQQWLSTIPALAKYVKVQGVFKSHSTLLLLSMPVSLWDVLPDDHACNFIAFIRSNNLAIPEKPVQEEEIEVEEPVEIGREHLNEPGSRFSFLSGTTAFTYMDGAPSRRGRLSVDHSIRGDGMPTPRRLRPGMIPSVGSSSILEASSSTANPKTARQIAKSAAPPFGRSVSSENVEIAPFINKYRDGRRTVLTDPSALANRPPLATHVQSRLEQYFQTNPHPTVAVKEFLASNLGIETADIDLWFHHRREQQEVSERLQSLTSFDNTQETSREGVQMLLPGSLKTLLEAVPSKDILAIDLRSPQDFERSHINDAINLRAPATFVSKVSLDMLEKSLDETSQRIFRNWQTTRCVVFYDRQIEFPWEVPVAEAMFQKLRAQQWPGQCFVLKGHYREFSASFDKYIMGTRMSDAAKEYLESLQDSSGDEKGDESYDEWLKLLEQEKAIYYAELTESAKAERVEATVAHQKELEDDFERKHQALHRKAQDLSPFKGNWTLKDSMVEHLDRGLEKMREGAEGKNTNRAISPSSKPHKHDYPRTTNEDKMDKMRSFSGFDDHDYGGGDPDLDLERSASDSFFKGAAPTRSSTNSGDDITADRKLPRLGGGRGFMTRLLHSRRPEGGN